MKLKVYVIDFELPVRAKKWALRIAVPTLVLGAAAVAMAAGPLREWKDGDVLGAADLNANFSNLQGQISSSWGLENGDLHNNNPSGRIGIGTSSPSVALDVKGQLIRTIARSHGHGPNDKTASGAIATRLLSYIKSQDATGLRIVWDDNLRCYGTDASCEWEIKVDGASCTTPGPLIYGMYNYAPGVVLNTHYPRSMVGTCFGVAKGPHTIQVYVKAPASKPPGGEADTGAAGQPYTGWNVAYWSLEVEEVY